MKFIVNAANHKVIHSFTRVLAEAVDIHEPNDVYLISPWLKDVRLPVGEVVFSTRMLRQEMRLLELLEHLLKVHRLWVVVKPPHELFALDELAPLRERLDLLEHAQAEQGHIRQAIFDAVIRHLRLQVQAAVDGLMVHVETITLARKLSEMGARVLFLPQLHAKLLWTPRATLFGSANFTNGGLTYNEELAAELDSAAVPLKLVQGFVERATPIEQYRLSSALRRAGVDSNTLADLGMRREVSFHPQLQQTLEYLAQMR
ncbi:hypothetical protein [Calidithermus chliarophilus]|uniref:hypothetical protein n=1 Tax=Calidithermus chliarophilus TaxID=52023 RepID=UPI000409EE3C|nr:hypothetical protein [Calidithermus chliarophilus]